jgi:hypothetical protein
VLFSRRWRQIECPACRARCHLEPRGLARLGAASVAVSVVFLGLLFGVLLRPAIKSAWPQQQLGAVLLATWVMYLAVEICIYCVALSRIPLRAHAPDQ